MNIRPVIRTVGFLIVFIAVSMLLSVAVGLIYGEGDAGGIALAAAVTAAIGLAAIYLNRGWKDLGSREGFAVVTFGWLMMSLCGSLPYLFTGAIPSVTDAFFESTSGFTTTGASILTEIEPLPHGVLFWRSFTHWIGGMGIIVFSIAILPFLGVGGMQMFKAESPGPTADKLTPRIRGTAEILWVVYVLFTAAEIVLLIAGGMSWFDAACHAFGTMATGGFSTKTASIGHYDSAYFEWVITFFMFAAGVSFSLHYFALRGKLKRYWQSAEFRFFLAAIVAAIAIVTIYRLADGIPFPDALRETAFQVVSIGTTTGYATADFETWHVFTQILLVALMLMGGMAGSTGGGIKAIRVLVLLQQARIELHKLIHPQTVYVIRVGRKVLQQSTVQNVLAFFLLYALLFGLGSLAMAMLGMDHITSMIGTIACLSNIGPGLGEVGPADNYAFIPTAGKWILAFLMIAGRLEIFTVLVLLTKTYWERV
ncbi:MAG: Trk system potassium uptake protein TrkH [Calditrichaeota bacterium]|nr:Trk system potassium uptake protein TrkH [Calditrichota bacterium]